MKARALACGLGGVALLLGVTACGAEGMDEGAEALGDVSEALHPGRLGVLAVNDKGEMLGRTALWRDDPMEVVPLPAGTKVKTAHGDGIGFLAGGKGERYLTTGGKVYERTRSQSGEASDWYHVPARGQAKLVDISSSMHDAMVVAVTEGGKLMVRTEEPAGPAFAEDNALKVTNGNTAETFSRIDVCRRSGDVLAISKDQRRLYRYAKFYKKWEKLSLSVLPGEVRNTPRVLDVACGTRSDEPSEDWYVIAKRDNEYEGLYQYWLPGSHDPEWKVAIEAVPWRNLSRLDADEDGDLWYVAWDYGNGSKLWRSRYVGDYRTIIPIAGTPVDVGL
jgi:hypothetical protein